MCGIVALVSRPSTRPAPSNEAIVGLLDDAVAAGDDFDTSLRLLHRVNDELKGVPGLQALLTTSLPRAIADRLARIHDRVEAADAQLEDTSIDLESIEKIAQRIIAMRDVLWSIGRDRIRTAEAVAGLLAASGRSAGPADVALSGYLLIQQSLSAIDRLEVRGRDSAGIHLFVWNHGLDENDPDVRKELDGERSDPLFQSGAVRMVEGVLSFVYKAAAEIGELGDNTRAIRRAIESDVLLHRALSSPRAQVSLLGHTRWASVGIISEPNAHPVNSERLSARHVETRSHDPYVIAALNGDVDNHEDLRLEYSLEFPGQITTDAKVIPALIDIHTSRSGDLVEGYRRSVSSFEGSVAIGAVSSQRPDVLLVSLRGSGQGLFIGIAEDSFIVASEPYGVVEETSTYLRMDGEGSNGAAEAPSGQIIVLDGSRAGELSGLKRLAFDGRELPVDPAEFVRAEVTTRDIDRGDAPHFLLKEISEAPESFRKTIRGRIVESDGRLQAVVGSRGLSDDIRADLANGILTKVRVIGQGTAAVAGWSCASILEELCDGRLDIDALTATELSGFHLTADMSDTLVVAVSQSGTTTDTNRTVDLARSRGAKVVAIVNRRGSDLCDKADSVIFTSDGRDVEMSVASTKAFYAQVAAGVLLACVISEAAGIGSSQRRHELLACMRDIPAAMRQLLATRDAIGDIARRHAPSKRYWAVVGNGPNSIAAHEIRIKLSELCYKSISCDITEDKKHIDLSSEPLILVCAAGLRGSTADDVAKEVAIYRAHKATPIVIAHDASQRYSHAVAVLEVPDVDPSLAFLMSAMVGHVFGYEAARAIDDLALPLREAREVVENAVARHRSADGVLREVRSGIVVPWERFGDSLRSGQFDGHLEASTALRVASMFRILAMESSSAASIERFQAETGKIGTPGAVLDDLTEALTRAIEELTRPIDAIKHQAKTVTVGISRSDEGVMDRNLVREILEIGVSRDVLGYRTLKVLAALDPAVAEILGFTRYRIEGEPKSGTAMVNVVDRGGVSLGLKSRAEEPTLLVGTKRHVAVEHEVLVARGRADDRTVILVPEVKGGHAVGVTLLHVRFHSILDPAIMRPVLQEYDRRYDRLVDWVLETEGEMDDSLLGRVSVGDLLILPISDVANRWRSPS